MVGEGYEIDAGKAYVTGPLIDAAGNDTGVKIQIRSGGAAQNFTPVTQIMYTDDSITLGYVYTDEAIQFSEEFPTVAIESGFEKNPQMIMWDPETYPDVTGIADLGTEGVKVRYFGGAAYMDYPHRLRTSSRRTGRRLVLRVIRACSSPTRAQRPSRASARPSRTCTRTSWPTGASPSSTSTSTTSGGRTTPSRSPRSRRTSTRSAPASPSWCRSSSRPASTTSTTRPGPTRSSSLPWPGSARTSAGRYTEGAADFGVGKIKEDGLVANGPDDTRRQLRPRSRECADRARRADLHRPGHHAEGRRDG